MELTHTKKAWHFFAFTGTFEVFDYLIHPITTSKAHAGWRERRCLTLGEFSESVEVSKVPVYKLLRFFLFYSVHKRVIPFFS